MTVKRVDNVLIVVDDLEAAKAFFIELGLTLASGIQFAFPNGRILNPGQFAVLAKNPEAFGNRYPGVQIDGVYTSPTSAKH